MSKSNRNALIGAGLSGAIFITLLIGVLTKATFIQQFDQTIVHTVLTLRQPPTTQFMIATSALGETFPVILICAVLAALLWYRHANRDAIFLIVTLASGTLLNTIIKHLVQRPRPFIADPRITPIVQIGGFSFPSGHSSATMLLYGSLVLIVWHLARTKSLRILVTILGGFMILATGLSRIYVQVHYPSDVLAGYTSALTLVLLLWALFHLKKAD